jgi:hypothetical protein
MSKSYLSDYALMAKLVDIFPRVAKWQKKLSDEKSQMAEMRAETFYLTSGGNTMILASQIMKVVASNYNNLFRPVIMTLKEINLGELSLDMMTYCIVRTFADK